MMQIKQRASDRRSNDLADETMRARARARSLMVYHSHLDFSILTRFDARILSQLFFSMLEN